VWGASGLLEKTLKIAAMLPKGYYRRIVFNLRGTPEIPSDLWPFFTSKYRIEALVGCTLG
jgi:hypothetical protein